MVTFRRIYFRARAKKGYFMKKFKFVRLISFLLLIATLIPAISACGKKKDDDPEEEELGADHYIKLVNNELNREALVDFNNTQITNNNPGLNSYISTEHVYDGDGFLDEKSLYFEKSNGPTTIKKILVNDWSDFTHITVAIYSEKATNTKFQFRFSTLGTPSSSGVAPYVRTPITVNWTGWKVFEFEIAAISHHYDPDLTRVQSVTIDYSGWDLNFSENNSLYISSIYLTKKEAELEVPEGVSLTDPAIYKEAKDQWRELLLGNPDKKAKHSKEYKAKVEEISETCKENYDLYKTTGKKSFGISVTHGNSGDEAKITTFYDKLLTMALGYGTVGSDYYMDEKLAADIENALYYGYEHFYGINITDAEGRGGVYGNWWNWDIGTPMPLCKILLILEDKLSADSISMYLSPFDHLNEYPSMTMANRMWIAYSVIASALLQQDAERILIAKDRLNVIFEYVHTGDGFYEDGSFIQHDKIPYVGGYGTSLLTTLTDVMMALDRTRFAYHEEAAKTQYKWMFENYIPLNYEGKTFSAVRGREVYRYYSDINANDTLLANMVKMSSYAPADVKAELKSVIRYHLMTFQNDYISPIPLCLVDYALKLKDDKSVTPVNYTGMDVFGGMDRIAQHGEKYGVCVALNSTRTYKYEAMAGENANGWYQTDGAIYIYTDGYSYGPEFYRNLNPYQIPGATATDVARKEDNNTLITNSSPFAGGVTNGKYGVTVFELGYAPSTHTTFTSSIKGNKSYFIFDNEIVAVGSGISDTSGNNVYTTIENRIWRKDDAFSVNGKETSVNSLSVTTANNLHFSNMGGYVFFEPTSVKYNKNTGSTSFLELWIEHGKKPVNEKYAYIYLPEASVSETTNYSSNPDVQILTQTDTIHVVKETKLGITGYAFYNKGEANGVKVSDRCAVMVEEKNGEYIISVSDPTHLLVDLEIELDLPVSQVVSADESASVRFEGGKAVITVSVEGNMGQTYTVTLK